MCLGISCYLQSSIAPNPLDYTMLIVTKLTGWSIAYSRILINIVLVTIAFFLDGSIGLGTLINTLFSGLIISSFLPRIERINKKIQRQFKKT